MSEQESGQSAAKGANIAMKQREAAQTKESQERANLKVSRERTKPLQEAINRVSQIDGVDFTFSSKEQAGRVDSTLTVGSRIYDVIIGAGEGGYEIYEQEESSNPDRTHAEYEGRNKNLKDALGGIVMILGYDYPEHASAIDHAVGNSERATVPEPPGPK